MKRLVVGFAVGCALLALDLQFGPVLGTAPATAAPGSAAAPTTYPAAVPASAPTALVTAPAGFTADDFARHIAELNKRIPVGKFTIVVESPFVVISDAGAEATGQWARGTVRWTVSQLKAAYFRENPAEILDIFLFKDKASYDKYTRAIFHDQPTTPYGYFSAADKALIMNIATGGGTLVHEIIHPFMRANFPQCPAWLNEGLGSLYEQSSEKNGHIVGQTNWRLAGLQKAIAAGGAGGAGGSGGSGGLPSFETLTGTTDQQFYRGDHAGTNYAQARYLCYYLQEKGLLTRFYKQFAASAKDDPTGYKTLQAVLGESDMKDFQRRWEKWSADLHFP